MADDQDKPIRKGPSPFKPIRIFKVSNPDIHNRMLQYRRYLLNKDWSNSKFQPAKPPTPATATPRSPGRQSFEVPLLLTFYETTRRSYEEAERVVAKINESFSCAGVSLRLDQDFTCPGALPRIDTGCPFAEDVDHEYEWLHLVFVANLPEDKPVLFNCGRCCLIPDKCDDRSIVRSVAMLLGIQPSQNVAHTGRLMGPESGYALTEHEVGWLRFFARMMVDEPTPFNKIVLPVWAYRVESPQTYRAQRSENEWRQILEGVSRIWAQAGIEFAFKGFAHLQESELNPQIWTTLSQGSLPECAPWLDPIFRHSSQSIQVILANIPKGREVYTDPARGVILVNETLQSNRSRTVSWALGCLLKLVGVNGVDQLMARNGEGFRFSFSEMVKARGFALARQNAATAAPKAIPAPATPGTLTSPTQAARPAAQLAELVIPVRVHLVLNPKNDCPLSLDQAKQLFVELNQLWKPAAIRWQVMQIDLLKLNDAVLECLYPNAPNHTTRKTSCSGVTSLPVYDHHSLHILYLNQLPLVPGNLFSQSNCWRPEHLVVTPLKFMKYTPVHGLARSLAHFLQLALVSNGPPELITSSGAAGTKFSPQEVTKARQNAEKLLAGLRVARPVQTQPERIIRVRPQLVRSAKHGTSASPEKFQELLQKVQGIWQKAGIRLILEPFQQSPLSDAGIENALPNEAGDTKRQRVWTAFSNAPGYDKGALNLFFLGQLTCVAGKNKFVTTYLKDARVLLATEATTPNELARALAGILGLTNNEYQARERLMSNTTGNLLDSYEAEKARAECLKLFP